MPRRKGELNQREFAELVGMKQPTVAQHIREGALKKSVRKDGGRYWIRPRAAKNELKQNLDPVYKRVIHGSKSKPAKKVEAKQTTKAVSKEHKEQVVKKSGIKAMDLNTAKTLETQYKAALRKLEYEEKNGELVSISKLVKVADAAGRQIKEQCLAIADRCSPLVAAENDQFICKQILLKEINYILDGISKMLEVKG